MPHSTGTAVFLLALKEVWAGGDTQDARGVGRSLPGCCPESWEAALWRRRLFPGLPICLGGRFPACPSLQGLIQQERTGRQADSQLGAWVVPKVTEHRQSENKGAEARGHPELQAEANGARPRLHQGRGPGQATVLPHLRGSSRLSSSRRERLPRYPLHASTTHNGHSSRSRLPGRSNLVSVVNNSSLGPASAGPALPQRGPTPWMHFIGQISSTSSGDPGTLDFSKVTYRV